jgi:hypothetical protein
LRRWRRIFLAKFRRLGAMLILSIKNSTSLYRRMEFRASWLKTGCDGLFQDYPAATISANKNF